MKAGCQPKNGIILQGCFIYNAQMEGCTIACINATYDFPSGKVNHMIKECKPPSITARAIEANVMLLVTFLVEVGFLMV